MSIKYIIFIVLFLSNHLLAATCFYVPCAPSTSLATTITTTNMEKPFLKISYELEEIDKSYMEYVNALQVNDGLYAQNIRSKVEFLLTVKEINKEKLELKLIKTMPKAKVNQDANPKKD